MVEATEHIRNNDKLSEHTILQKNVQGPVNESTLMLEQTGPPRPGQGQDGRHERR